MIYVMIFCVMYLAVFAKAIQQLNTTFKNYGIYVPVSIFLFSMEAVGLSTIAWVAFPHEIVREHMQDIVASGLTLPHILSIFQNVAWSIVVIGGVGAGCGGMTGMWVHKKFIPVGKGYYDKKVK